MQTQGTRGALARTVGGPAECVAALAVLMLAAVAVGAIGLPGRAWSLPLWTYQPRAFAALAAGAAVLLCLRPVREHCLALGSRVAALRPPLWARLVLGLLLVLALFALREQRLLGDSSILLHATSRQLFHVPDVGATWIFHGLARAGARLGVGRLPALQLGLCVAGAGSIACLAGLAHALAPSRGRSLGFVAIVLCGGLLRVLAGHVEVYALVLCAASAFLWSGCACLAGRTPLWGPALVFGLGLWLHPSFLFLAPALLWLAVSQRGASRGWLAAIAVAAPLCVFALAVLASGGGDALGRAWQASLAVATGGEDNGGRWLRPPFAEPGPGTRWSALSLPHLRYLANCAFLLAPAALPLLLGLGIGARSKSAPSSPTSRFLAIAALGTLVYPCLLRPIWGPYDWDLFSLTALCAACLAAQWWTHWRAAEAASLGLLLAGASFLLVGLPFLLLGLQATHPAGPWALERLEIAPGESLWQAVDRLIAAWL